MESKSFKLPGNIAIETTTDCNRTCEYCPLGDPELKKGRGVKEISDELYSFIISELAEVKYGGKLALQGYGEPLRDEKIVERIREARLALPRAYITLNSNGDYLSKKVLGELLEAGLSHIYVTNHSGKQQPNKNLQEVLDDPGMSKYMSYYQKLVKLENRGGLVSLDNYKAQGRAADRKDINRCVTTLHTMTINVDGTVSFCSNDFERKPEELIGKVGPGGSSVVEVWNSPKYKRIRNNRRGGDLSHPICTRCNVPFE